MNVIYMDYPTVKNLRKNTSPKGQRKTQKNALAITKEKKELKDSLEYNENFDANKFNNFIKNIILNIICGKYVLSDDNDTDTCKLFNYAQYTTIDEAINKCTIELINNKIFNKYYSELINYYIEGYSTKKKEIKIFNYVLQFYGIYLDEDTYLYDTEIVEFIYNVLHIDISKPIITHYMLKQKGHTFDPESVFMFSDYLN